MLCLKLHLIKVIRPQPDSRQHFLSMMNEEIEEHDSSLKVNLDNYYRHGLLQKLNLLQLKGCLQSYKYGHHMKLFEKLPRRLSFRLADLVTESVLQSGHVFLGFTKDGQFVISYTLQVEADEQTSYPFYVYCLHCWQFVPYRPLQKVSEMRLFGSQEITQDLKIAVCQWPTDESRILIYGCSASTVQDAVQCYITITAAPSMQSCTECAKLKNVQASEGVNLPSSATTIPKKCLQHCFTIHTKYTLVPPFPPFNPSICMKMDEVVLINTGDSLVFLYANLENKSQNPDSHNFNKKRGKVSTYSDLDVEIAVTSTSSISNDSQLSWNFVNGSSDDCLKESSFEAYSDLHCLNNQFINQSCLEMCSCSCPLSHQSSLSSSEALMQHANNSDNCKKFKFKIDKSCSCDEAVPSLNQESCQQTSKIQQKRTKIEPDNFHPLLPKEKHDYLSLNENCEHLLHSESVTSHVHYRDKMIYCLKHQHISEYSKLICFNQHPECEPTECLGVKINDADDYSSFPMISPDVHSPGGLSNTVSFPKQKKSSNEKIEDISESHDLSGVKQKDKVSCLISCCAATKHIASKGISDTDNKILAKKSESCLFRTEVSKWLKTNEESIKENISPSSRNYVMIFGSSSKQIIKDKEYNSEKLKDERNLDCTINDSSNQFYRSYNTNIADTPFQQPSNIWCITQSMYFVKDDSVPESVHHHAEMADDSCPEYHNVLQLEVYGSGYIPLKMIHENSITKEKRPVLVVHQLAFDIEQYAHEMAQKLCAKAGKKFLAFNDYDVQVIDLCPLTGTAVVLVLILVQATVGKKGVAKAIRSSERQLYQTGFKFEWNVFTGMYSVIDTEELKSVDHYDKMHDRWNPAHQAVQRLQKEWYIPQSFTRSVNVLTNEAVFKGLPLRILWAPTHHVAIYL